MQEETLFGPPPVQSSHPETSRAASDLAAVNAGALRERITRHLLRVGGATAYECWKACGGKYPHVAGTRLNELANPKSGPALVYQTDKRRPTDSGTPAVVWSLTPEGVREAERLAQRVA